MLFPVAGHFDVGAIETSPIWVDQDQQLAELCQRWSGQAAIALDTEFIREQTFFPIAGLIQVGDGQGCYLIDPLKIEDFSPFCELLQNPAVTKILHSCSEDLEVFQRFLGVIPQPVFDTQLAAAIDGVGFSMGYARLVNAMLGIDVPKGETRSNWLQRPLSQSQMNYAALDVAYLPVVYGKLVASLREKQRHEWVKEDCAALVSAASAPCDPDIFYLKVKSAWKLNRCELGLLQKLCTWRESLAVEKDQPRNRIIKERALWELSRAQPLDLHALSLVEGASPKLIREHGEHLLSLVQINAQEPQEKLPLKMPPPLPPAVGDLLKRLKAACTSRAEALQVAPEILVRKKDLEVLVRAFMAGEFNEQTLVASGWLKGWRFSAIGQDLLSLIKTEQRESRC